jgi:hypothetical protein
MGSFTSIVVVVVVFVFVFVFVFVVVVVVVVVFVQTELKNRLSSADYQLFYSIAKEAIFQ